MSIQSKARREAKKRKATKERNVARANTLAIEPHAELRNPQGDLLAGIVRRDGEWVLGMDGRIAGHSESAAQVLALIMQAGELHERNGTPVRLMLSLEMIGYFADAPGSQRYPVKGLSAVYGDRGDFLALIAPFSAHRGAEFQVRHANHYPVQQQRRHHQRHQQAKGFLRQQIVNQYHQRSDSTGEQQ